MCDLIIIHSIIKTGKQQTQQAIANIMTARDIVSTVNGEREVKCANEIQTDMLLLIFNGIFSLTWSIPLLLQK